MEKNVKKQPILITFFLKKETFGYLAKNSLTFAPLSRNRCQEKRYLVCCVVTINNLIFKKKKMDLIKIAEEAFATGKTASFFQSR